MDKIKDSVFGKSLADAIDVVDSLANAAKNSNKVPAGDMQKCCDLTGHDTCDSTDCHWNYNSFYNRKVNENFMCMKGVCDAGVSKTGRALAGAPNCTAEYGLDYTFLEQCRRNNRHDGAYQYFGSESGAYTIYPAHVADCGDAN